MLTGSCLGLFRRSGAYQ